MVMPIKRSETKFDIIPYGYFQLILVVFALLLLVFGLIFLGVYYNNPASWIFYVLAGIAFVGTIAFVIYKIWKRASGAEKIITFDLTGVKVHSKKEGVIQFFPWTKVKSIQTGYERDEDYGSYASAMEIYTTDEEQTIVINLDTYGTVFLKTDRLASEIESGFRSFKAKHQHAQKTNKN
jgi:hypothetical protein